MVILWILLFIMIILSWNDLVKMLAFSQILGAQSLDSQSLDSQEIKKSYLLSILCYRTDKPGPSNYPCQYLEWSSGVPIKIGDLNYIFYGKIAGQDDQLIQGDGKQNLANLYGLSDSNETTFSAIILSNHDDHLIVARSNGVFMYRQISSGKFEKITLYLRDKTSEPYALALSEFIDQKQVKFEPIAFEPIAFEPIAKTHISRCVNPRWIKPIILSNYQDSNSMTLTTIVDLTPDQIEPDQTDKRNQFLPINLESNEFGIDQEKLNFKVNGFENMFDLYKDQILARSDRTVKYFILKNDGQISIPDFKKNILIDEKTKTLMRWIEILKTQPNTKLFRVGLPSQDYGAEITYGNQHQITDSVEVEFHEDSDPLKTLEVSMVSGQKYQLNNPKFNRHYQLSYLWEPKSEILSKFL